MKQQEARRHAELMEAIREYVTVATAPFLSQKALDTLLTNIEQIACGRTDSCLPLRSNPDRPLRSPELRHLAWNIGERWKSHATLTLLATQDCPLWLQYD